MSAPQPDTGSVTLAATLVNGVLRNVRVRSRRPAIASFLAGRPPSVVETALPLLYAICRRAQGAAAATALAAAGGNVAATAVSAAVAAEAVRELLFAALTGDARRQLAEAQRRLFDIPSLRTFLQDELFGMPLQAFHELRDEADLLAWADAGAAPLQIEARRRLALAEPAAAQVPSLPLYQAAEMLQGLPAIDAAFAAQPQWQGAAAETGPLARQGAQVLVARLAARPLLQRWIARLMDLAQHAGGEAASLLGQVSAASPEAGLGISLVETARGVLLHQARLRQDAIADYVIVAPTEWNFHPQGAIPAWLTGRDAPTIEIARDWLHRAAEALDPCVVCQLLVE